MKKRRLIKDIILISIWFASIIYYMFGAGSYLYYDASLVLNVLSLIIIFNYRVQTRGLVKSIYYLTIIAIISSSLNFPFFDKDDHGFIKYLSFGISAYLACIAAYSFVSKLGKNGLRIIYVYFVIIYLIGFVWYSRTNQLLDSIYKQNNTFYYVLTPLPFLLCINNKMINVLYLLASGFICVFSTKRSALIAIILLILLYIIQFLRSQKKDRLKSIVIVGSFIFIGGHYLVKNYLDDRLFRTFDRMEQISDDGGSGRVEISDKIWENDMPDLINFPGLFIGKGFEGIRHKHNLELLAAHNDYQEILYSYGIIGFIIFLTIYYRIFQLYRKHLKRRSQYSFGILACLTLFLLYGLLSNVFYFFFYFIPLFIFLGAMEAEQRNENFQIYKDSKVI